MTRPIDQVREALCEELERALTTMGAYARKTLPITDAGGAQVHAARAQALALALCAAELSRIADQLEADARERNAALAELRGR